MDKMSVLQFADDTIMFLNNTDDFSYRIQWCLTIFFLITGLKIKLRQTTLIGVGRDLSISVHIALNLGCRVDNFLFDYLGNPIGGRILDCSSFNPLVDIFRSILFQWKCRHLFMADRCILLKSVLCSIPVYILSLRVLPMRVRTTLHGLMSRFLWGGSDERRKLHLVDWQTVTHPCNQEGLGVTDLSVMNVALLAKWVYLYANDRNHLWRQIVFAKSCLVWIGCFRILPTKAVDQSYSTC